jgi:hypothetical protein
MTISAGPLTLTCRKLDSGRFQISFTISDRGYYGYLLAEPKTPFRDVLEKIDRHLEAMHEVDRYYQRSLYDVGSRNTASGRILIFKR